MGRRRNNGAAAAASSATSASTATTNATTGEAGQQVRLARAESTRANSSQVPTQVILYRVTLVVGYLGWVDFNLESSAGWWAATVVTYCPSRMVEHPKSKSTKVSDH